MTCWTKDLVPGGNILLWLLFSIGNGVLMCLYGFEWYARINCPRVLVNILPPLLSYKGKGKSVPLQAWSGPEGSRKLRFPDFMTMAQGGGKVVSLMHRPHISLGNSPSSHFG